VVLAGRFCRPAVTGTGTDKSSRGRSGSGNVHIRPAWTEGRRDKMGLLRRPLKRLCDDGPSPRASFRSVSIDGERIRQGSAGAVPGCFGPGLPAADIQRRPANGAPQVAPVGRPVIIILVVLVSLSRQPDRPNSACGLAFPSLP